MDKQQLPEVSKLRDCKVTCHHSLQHTRRKGYAITKPLKTSFRYCQPSNLPTAGNSYLYTYTIIHIYTLYIVLARLSSLRCPLPYKTLQHPELSPTQHKQEYGCHHYHTNAQKALTLTRRLLISLQDMSNKELTDRQQTLLFGA